VFGSAALPTRMVVMVALPTIVVQCEIGHDLLGTISGAGPLIALVVGCAVAYASDHWDLRIVTIGALVLASVAAAALSAAATWPAYLVMAWCVAVAMPVTSSGTLYKLARDPRHGETAIIRFQLIIALVAMLTPPLAGGVLKATARVAEPRHAWRWVLLALSVAQLGWILMVVRTPREDVPARARPGWDRYRLLLRQPRTYALILLAALHAGADTSAYCWIVLMAKERFAQLGAGDMGLLLGVINSSYVLGRAVMMRVNRGSVRKGGPPEPNAVSGRTRRFGMGHIAALSPLGAIGLLAAVFCSNTYGAFVALCWVGWLCLSVNWPILHTSAREWFPQTPSAAMGVVAAGSTIGSALALKAVGSVGARAGNLALGFLVPAGMLVLLSLVALAVRPRREHGAEHDRPGASA